MEINMNSNLPLVYQFKNINAGTVFCPVEAQDVVLMKMDTVTDKLGELWNAINLKNGLFWYLKDEQKIIYLVAEIDVEMVEGK
jgi:hypothetical protein